MKRRDDITSIISSNYSISFTSWISLLNYFSAHKKVLTVDEVELLAEACDRIRNELNRTIDNKIRKQDTNPNIHRHLSYLKQKRKQTRNKTNNIESAHLRNVVMVQQ